jgi:hypothetical protein
MIASFRKRQKKKQRAPCDPAFDAYVRTIQQLKRADLVIIVLDARNPCACRYPPFEALLSGSLVLVLNKIDLVPREAALAWVRALSCVAPTFALQATKDAGCLLAHLRALRADRGRIDCAIAGVPRVGKRTLAQCVARLPHVGAALAPPWTWLEATADLIALSACGAAPGQGGAVAGARDFAARCSIHSLMDVFRVPFFSDVECVLQALGPNPRARALAFLAGVASGRWRHFTMPPAKFTDGSVIGLSDDQILSLRNAKPYDALPARFLFLSCGAPGAVSQALVPLVGKLVA